MQITSPRLRRATLDLTRLAAVLSAVMLIVSVWTFAVAGRDPVGAATVVGTATITGATSGGSSSPFSIQLPAGAACSGDSASGGYRVQSYMVPESVDPGTLVYAATGPTPAAFGANFRKPLYAATGGQAFVNRNTDVTTGVITGIPGFNFALFDSTLVPAQTYNVGIACTVGAGAEQVLDKYWNARLTIEASGSDPKGFAWSVPADTGTTTTTVGSTTTTAGGTTTTTEVGGTTTTTEGGGTTTTTEGGGTTTTTDGTQVQGDSVFGGTPSAASPVSTAGQLPYTGGSPLPMVVWAVALLLFGRMAMLLGKRPKIVGDGPPE